MVQARPPVGRRDQHPGPEGADSSAGYVFQVVEWNARDEVWVISHAAHGDEQLCHLKLDDNVRPDGSLGLSRRRRDFVRRVHLAGRRHLRNGRPAREARGGFLAKGGR